MKLRLLILTVVFIVNCSWVKAQDATIVFTDGLTEAENINHELFNMERVKEVAENQLIATMTDAVHQYVGEAEQSDDLTMMGIQFQPGK